MNKALRAAACCLALSACLLQPTYASPIHNHLFPSTKYHEVNGAANFQVVHNGGSTIRNIVSVTLDGVAVTGASGAYPIGVFGNTTTGAHVVTVTYSNMGATDCFNVFCCDENSTQLYSANYAGTNTATFSVTLPATSTFLYIQFLDNIACSGI